MRNIRQLFVALIITTLAACGGGGTLDSDGDTGGPGDGNTPVYTVTIALTDAAGEPSSALAQATPLTATATLTATNNGVVAGRLVEFELSNTALATLSNTAGTAVTNADGVATISLLAGSSSGAGSVTASYEDASADAAFTSVGDGGDQVDVTVGSVVLIADTLQLGTAIADKIELTALVRDSNNVVVEGVPVTFAADSGELTQLDSVTGANGVARATLATQSAKSNRNIVVTAGVQQQTAELTVSVVGNQLEIAAPDSIVLGDTVTIDVFLTDSSGAGIQGTEVQVVSALENSLSDDSPATAGTSGKASFSYNAVNSGTDSLTVTAAGVTAIASINVSADAFAFLTLTDIADDALPGDPVQEVALNTAQKVEVEWLVNNAANPAAEVTFSTTRGVVADEAANLANAVSATNDTDGAGVAEAYVRSAYAGLVTLSAAGGSGNSAVSAKKVIEFIATVPTKIETQATPSQVGPGEISTIRAVLRDANNNPVKNQTIVFSLDNAAGGTISSGTAITNSQGIATTVFTADATSGAGVDGLNLKIQAALQSNNAIVDATDIAVGERTLFFRFGTGNTIQKPSESTYQKEFSVIVTDSSGNPVEGQTLNLSVTPINYFKGDWVKNPAVGTFLSWVPAANAIECPNEDANLNGIKDDGEDDTGLGNNNGELTPGNRATSLKTITADENGIAVFLLTYPQDVGAWMTVRLQVSGSSAGTENVSYRDYRLAYSQDDADDEANAPVTNAFGVELDCTTTR
ncbi:Ig-like domain-containing protein [Rheinheimera sp.]|uniref:beta strand repeat-containing protein n=1 Tax=Rheinheimera sp. TaxID=1869214 RepID=UPI0027366B28|nr:Ig-like domain-containing protein [Rheinheimera sp.]MDP2715426.1 Ig-like domain-containing protein [Rheinheimera sp.]